MTYSILSLQLLLMTSLSSIFHYTPVLPVLFLSGGRHLLQDVTNRGDLDSTVFTRATLYVPRTVLEALGLHLIQDPSEKGGVLAH